VPITSATDLTAQVRVLAGGSTGTLTYVRGNSTATATVNLGTFTG
jgi:putative serine protease PepD